MPQLLERMTHTKWMDTQESAEDFADSIERIVDAMLSRLPDDSKLIYLEKLNGISGVWSGMAQTLTECDPFDPGHEPGCNCAMCAE